MTQKSDWKYPVLTILGCAFLAGAGCSDDTSSQDGEGGGWIDARGDLGDDTADADDDTGIEDTRPDAGGSDADAHADGEVFARGWYTASFETSMFVPEPTLLEGDWAGGCTLSLWQNADDAGVEKWWTNGISETELLDSYPPTATTGGGPKIGLVDATGTLSALGQHGHLGAYDRTFDVTTSSVDVCATFEALGHCVVPRGWCTKEDIEPFELEDTYLVRELPGAQPSEPTLFYNLKISSDKSGEWTELRLDLAVPGEDQSADDAELPVYTVEQLREATLTRHTEAFAITDTTFDNLTGWVALDTTSLRESIYVSIAGEDPDGHEVHIWGYFAVDETIAYP